MGQQWFYFSKHLHFATRTSSGWEVSKEGLEPAGCLVLQQAGKVAVQLVLLCPKDSSQATGDIPLQQGVVFNEHQNAVSHLLLFFLVNGWAGEPP